MHKFCTEWTLRTIQPIIDYFETSSVDLTLFQKVQNFCLKPNKKQNDSTVNPSNIYCSLFIFTRCTVLTFLAGDRNSISLGFLINYNKDLFIRSYTLCAFYTAQSSNFTSKGCVCLKKRRPLQGIVIRTQQFYSTSQLRSGTRQQHSESYCFYAMLTIFQSLISRDHSLFVFSADDSSQTFC